jgi:hypothetical protein
MRKTNPLYLFKSGLQRTAGPYRGSSADPGLGKLVLLMHTPPERATGFAYELNLAGGDQVANGAIGRLQFRSAWSAPSWASDWATVKV